MSNDSFLTFRTMVSRVYRLSMLIAANQHEKAANVFDGFVDDLAAIVGNSNVDGEIRMLDEFLQRDRESATPPVQTKGIRLEIHEEEPFVQVHKCEISGDVEADAEETDFDETDEVETIEAEVANETEEVAEYAEETVEIEEAEAEDTDAAQETEEAEETEAEDTEAAQETEEAEETEAEDTEAAQETEEAEETEADEETAETEAAEETEEAETAEETEETEETEEAEEEEVEEGSYEPIKIGKSMYFLDTSTQYVFEYISEEEAGEYVGKLVAGKLIRG